MINNTDTENQYMPGRPCEILLQKEKKYSNYDRILNMSTIYILRQIDKFTKRMRAAGEDF